MKVYKAGIVGLGFMGAAHLENYKLLEKNGFPVKLIAVCDADEKKLSASEAVKGNLDTGAGGLDLSAYACYRDMAEMIKKEDLDFVDLCLPTYLHGPMAIEAMEAGLHVFCEKPMALTSDMCQKMIDVSVKTGKLLMIGHTLRYWDSYEYLKQAADDGRFGACTAAYFFRGGVTPVWSWQNWLLQKDKSGGCLLDQHVHDVDVINWLFGLPDAVSSVGKIVNEGSGYDAVSTNYIYKDKVVNAQDDWTINGEGFGFKHTYRVNFEKAAIVFREGATTVYPVGEPCFDPELNGESGYYKELRLFIGYLQNPAGFDAVALLESHRDTIRLAEAEMASCDRQGEKISLTSPN